MAVDVDGLRHGVPRFRRTRPRAGPGAWQAVHVQRRQTCRSRSRRRYHGTMARRPQTGQTRRSALAGPAGGKYVRRSTGTSGIGLIIGSVPRFVKADLIYFGPEDPRATAPDRPGPAQRHRRRRRGEHPPDTRRDRPSPCARGRPDRIPELAITGYPPEDLCSGPPSSRRTCARSITWRAHRRA